MNVIFWNFWQKISFYRFLGIFSRKNEDCLKSPFHVVISGSVKIRRSGNFPKFFGNLKRPFCITGVIPRSEPGPDGQVETDGQGWTRAKFNFD